MNHNKTRRNTASGATPATTTYLWTDAITWPSARELDEVAEMHAESLHKNIQGLSRPDALLLARTRIVEELNAKRFLNDLCAPRWTDIQHIQRQHIAAKVESHSEPLETIYRDAMAQLTASGLNFSELQQYVTARPKLKGRKVVQP